MCEAADEKISDVRANGGKIALANERVENAESCRHKGATAAMTEVVSSSIKITQGILPQRSQRNAYLEIKAAQVKDRRLNSEHIQVKRTSTNIRQRM